MWTYCICSELKRGSCLASGEATDLVPLCDYFTVTSLEHQIKWTLSLTSHVWLGPDLQLSWGQWHQAAVAESELWPACRRGEKRRFKWRLGEISELAELIDHTKHKTYPTMEDSCRNEFSLCSPPCLRHLITPSSPVVSSPMTSYTLCFLSIPNTSSNRQTPSLPTFSGPPLPLDSFSFAHLFLLPFPESVRCPSVWEIYRPW